MRAACHRFVLSLFLALLAGPAPANASAPAERARSAADSLAALTSAAAPPNVRVPELLKLVPDLSPEAAALTSARAPEGWVRPANELLPARLAAPFAPSLPADGKATTSAEQPPGWVPDAPGGPAPAAPSGAAASASACAICPPDAQVEDEPICGTGYVDATNGGCNSTPNVFNDVTCGVICGETGTYLTAGGSNFRDTDWYRITVGAGTHTLTGVGDGFRLRLFVMNPSCPASAIATTTSESCVESGALTFTGPGTFYLFAGPDVFTGVACGSKYRLTITGPTAPVCCVQECPPDAQVENEPLCATGYVDATNGGCNSTPNVFTDVTCGVICGETGTYLTSGGANFRDTDWYRITVGAGTYSYEGISSGYKLRLFVMNPSCPASTIATTTSESCVESSELTFTGPGTFYLFAGPDVFTGVACGSKYRLTVTGPSAPVCCVQDCPPNAQVENEPLCATGYVDATNGGCNSTPNVFMPVTCNTICGETGTYVTSGGSNFRDTDWYSITVGPGTFRYSGTGSGFRLRLFVMNATCPASVVATTTSESCVESSALTFTGPGTFYLFAGPDVFTGVPCGSKYQLRISGPGVPGCCVQDCPPGAQVENEALCANGYVDATNGGCNSTPNVFTDVTCGVICGETGTYLTSGGANFRDTDWYRITVGAGTYSYEGISSGYKLRLFVMNPSCPASTIATTTSASCTPSSPLTFTGPGTFYLFAGPDVFSGVPCGSKYRLVISGPGIPLCSTTAVDGSPGGAPASLAVRNNPFRAATTFELTLPRAGRVRLEIFDASGRKVRTFDDPGGGAGSRSLSWDGRDESGRPLHAGLYLCALSLDDQVLARTKTILLR